MKVVVGDKIYEFNEKMSASKLVKRLGFEWEEVLVLKDGTLITEDEILTPKDSIKIIKVASGG